MKKLFFIMITLLPVTAICQTLKEYKAPNGKTYHIGDTVKVGMGSMPDGNFKYIQVTQPSFLPPRRNGNEMNARKDFSLTNAIIKKIKSVSQISGGEKIIFTTKTGGLNNYDIWIVEAIAACEVTPCTAAGSNAASHVGVADELLKLKKLLDAGGITQAEYNAQKKKLLGE
ncbi:SHOCT domain-containing protein [Mucilaginibacter sp. BJC16-A38]|uniref:SHOCT domain-containing protein n=1 Tax=Mucilaginibacter phenanthrenivorans TaxID=1234842 RepID=UPI002157C80C|nr:SHOCT domain-containing protein [Mucilaginibacter phenanthrenivorans]MCR8556414.1 SHOCT domain-containing protein [Mucilaginibacter phenanthrenivorans]